MWAAIETTGLEKGHVEDRGKLRGEMKFDFKTPLAMPTIYNILDV
jgi:hypothetical protein